MTIYTEAPIVSKIITVPFSAVGTSVEIFENTFEVILTYLPNATNPRICNFAFSPETSANLITPDANAGTFSATTGAPQTFTIEPATRRPLGKTMFLVAALTSSPVGDNHLCVTQIVGGKT